MPLTFDFGAITGQQRQARRDPYADINKDNWNRYAAASVYKAQQQRTKAGKQPLNADEQQAVMDAHKMLVGIAPSKSKLQHYYEGKTRTMEDSPVTNWASNVMTTLGGYGTGLIGLAAPETAHELGQTMQEHYSPGGGVSGFAGRAFGNAAMMAPAIVAGAAAGTSVLAAKLAEYGTLALFGATAAGGTRADIAGRRQQGEEVSGLQEFGAAALNGTIEVLTEMVGMKAAKGLSNLVIGELGTKGVMELGRGLRGAMAAGATEEFMAQIGQNIVNKYVAGDESVNILEGMQETLMQGAIAPVLTMGLGQAGQTNVRSALKRGTTAVTNTLQQFQQQRQEQQAKAQQEQQKQLEKAEKAAPKPEDIESPEAANQAREQAVTRLEDFNANQDIPQNVRDVVTEAIGEHIGTNPEAAADFINVSLDAAEKLSQPRKTTATPEASQAPVPAPAKAEGAVEATAEEPTEEMTFHEWLTEEGYSPADLKDSPELYDEMWDRYREYEDAFEEAKAPEPKKPEPQKPRTATETMEAVDEEIVKLGKTAEEMTKVAEEGAKPAVLKPKGTMVERAKARVAPVAQRITPQAQRVQDAEAKKAARVTAAATRTTELEGMGWHPLRAAAKAAGIEIGRKKKALLIEEMLEREGFEKAEPVGGRELTEAQEKAAIAEGQEVAPVAAEAEPDTAAEAVPVSRPVQDLYARGLTRSMESGNMAVISAAELKTLGKYQAILKELATNPANEDAMTRLILKLSPALKAKARHLLGGVEGSGFADAQDVIDAGILSIRQSLFETVTEKGSKSEGKRKIDTLIERGVSPGAFLLGQNSKAYRAMRQEAFPLRGRSDAADRAALGVPEVQMGAVETGGEGSFEEAISEAQGEERVRQRFSRDLKTEGITEENITGGGMEILVEQFGDEVRTMKQDGKSDDQIIEFLKKQNILFRPTAATLDAMADGATVVVMPKSNKEAWAKVDRELAIGGGLDAVPVMPSTDTEAEVQRVAASLGVDVLYVQGMGASIGAAGLSTIGDKTILLEVGRGEGSLWSTMFHETWHVLGLDKQGLRGKDRQLIEQAKRRYMAKARSSAPQLATVLEENPALLEREAVAELAGNVLRSAEARARLLQESPSLYRRVMDGIKRMMARWSGKSSVIDDIIYKAQRAMAANRDVWTRSGRAVVSVPSSSVVDSPRFTTWFADSQVSQTDGTPTVVRETTPGSGQYTIDGTGEAAYVRVERPIRVTREGSQSVAAFTRDVLGQGTITTDQARTVASALGNSQMQEQAKITEAARMVGQMTGLDYDGLQFANENGDRVYAPLNIAQQAVSARTGRPAKTERLMQPLSEQEKNQLQADIVEIAKLGQSESDRKRKRANPGMDPLTRSAQKAMENIYDALHIPKPESEAAWDKKAAKQLKAAGPEYHEAIRKLQQRKMAADPVEQTLMGQILDEKTDAALSANTVQAWDEAFDLTMGHRRVGTEQAKIFAARHDRFAQRTRSVKGFVADSFQDMPDHVGERIDRALGAGDLDAAAKIEQEYKQRWIDMVARWKKAGIDIEELDQYIKDHPDAKYRIIKDLDRMFSPSNGAWSVIHEWRRNSLMFSPATTVRNMLGGAYAVADTFITKPIADTLLKLAGRGTPGRTAARIAGGYASPTAWGRAFVNLARTLKHEIPTFDADVRMQVGTEEKGSREAEQHRSAAITGEWVGGLIGPRAGRVVKGIGRLVRIPQAINSAVDQFVKTLHANGEVAGHAVKIGVEKGLEPGSEEMADFVEAQVKDMTSTAWASAMETGETNRVTFQADAGGVEKAVMAMTKERGLGHIGRLLIPFRKTPVQLKGQAAMYTPFGLAEMGHRAYQAVKGTKAYDQETVARHAAQQLIGLAGLVYLLSLDDDDEEWITPPASFTRKDAAERKTTQQVRPYSSIKIGGKWRSYKNLEPFSEWLGTLAAVAGELKQNKGRPTTQARRAWSRISSQATDQSFIRTLGDLHKVAVGGDEYTARQFGVNFAGSWLPNIVDSSMRDMDPYIRERKVMGVPGERPTVSKSIMREMLPTQDILPPPKVDWFGHDIKKPDHSASLSYWAIRKLIPGARATLEGKEADVFQMMINYNQTKDPNDRFDKPMWMQTPSHKVRVRYPNVPEPVTEDMNETEYHIFTKLSGLVAGKAIANRAWPVTNPQKSDINRLKDIFEDKRKIVREDIAALRALKARGDTAAYAKLMQQLYDTVTKLEK